MSQLYYQFERAVKYNFQMPTKSLIEQTELRWDGRKVGKESRRESILSSVGSFLSSGRLSSLTMQDIANELGITKGNLYYYFTDKQDILYQCHMRAMESSMRALLRAHASDLPLDTRLHQLLVDHVTGILKDGLGSVLLTDLESLHPEQRDAYVTKRDEFERGVRAMIEEGMRTGLFHCDESQLAGFAMLGSINWITKWFHPDGRLSVEEVAYGISDFLMAGLYCPPGARRSLAKQVSAATVSEHKEAVESSSKVQPVTPRRTTKDVAKPRRRAPSGEGAD